MEAITIFKLFLALVTFVFIYLVYKQSTSAYNISDKAMKNTLDLEGDVENLEDKFAKMKQREKSLVKDLASMSIELNHVLN